MADEGKTFAEQRVTEDVLSESDRIRKRITDYKAPLNPQSLGAKANSEAPPSEATTFGVPRGRRRQASPPHAAPPA